MAPQRLRVVFMGTPEFAVPALNALHGARDPLVELVAVYTQPDRPVGRGLGLRPSPVKKRALELGLAVYQPEKLLPPEEFERFKQFRPDVVVVVAFGKILRQHWLDVPRLGFVNIHSSLLPRWRGAAPIQRAILSGDQETGVTTMQLVEKLDAGNILLQARTPISALDTAGTVHDRLAEMGAELIVPTLHGLASGALLGKQQDEALVTYAAKLSKEMECLNPLETASQLDRNVRALNPWPGTSLWVQGSEGKVLRLKVKRAQAYPDIKGVPGKIFEKIGMSLLGTAEGSLELQSVQWDGKKEVDSAGFMNGLKGRGEALPLNTVSPPKEP